MIYLQGAYQEPSLIQSGTVTMYMQSPTSQLPSFSLKTQTTLNADCNVDETREAMVWEANA